MSTYTKFFYRCDIVPDTGQTYFLVPASGLDFRHRYMKVIPGGTDVFIPNPYHKQRPYSATSDFRRDKLGNLIVRIFSKLYPTQYYCLGMTRSGEPVPDSELLEFSDYVSGRLEVWVLEVLSDELEDDAPPFLESDGKLFTQLCIPGPPRGIYDMDAMNAAWLADRALEEVARKRW